MTNKSVKPLRCAIYTRKSTEHGLELEFNSLDAQRDACEAYIKSQMHEGWIALTTRYDDPAYSGGNLDRPALQRLLQDIDAGRIDVVVVYKIDRLTRSLADFAKLVETFDRKTISFVAVTQQFNTTTSMGRLTLNVLLSFAQFERELSSERVRDKVAASRKKGIWTGGGIPLGYDVKGKKLIVNQDDAETVRFIYRRYLELKSIGRLTADLAQKKIVTKKRGDSNGRLAGGLRLTYGPLAYLLKNRIYRGEISHKGDWYPAEHAATIDPALFDAVQALSASNSVNRRQLRTQTQSLLGGLIFDDRDNAMSPSFTTKRGVRYRSYVSAAILSGRREQAGSLTRVSAPDLEASVVTALRERFAQTADVSDRDFLASHIRRIVLSKTSLRLLLNAPGPADGAIEVTRPEQRSSRARIETDSCQPHPRPNISMVHALGRAHLWRRALCDGTYQSIEELAANVQWHPKVVRKLLRLAFLAPDITEAIILGRQPPNLRLDALQNVKELTWDTQRSSLGFSAKSGAAI